MAGASRKTGAYFLARPFDAGAAETGSRSPSADCWTGHSGRSNAAHPIAQALILEARVPIAAPSANLFTQLSPTTAQHVLAALGDRVAMVLDGGRTTVGIESTVLSLVGSGAVLLRPGMVTRQQIEEVIGPVQLLGPVTEGAHASPGLHHRHYSPKTPLILMEAGQAPPSGRGIVLPMPDDPRAYASVLYERLHQADAEGWDWIAIAQPPAGE